MKFWKFSICGLILTVIEDDRLEETQIGRLCDWRRGPGADQLVWVHPKTGAFSGLDGQGNDGMTLIGTALAGVGWSLYRGQPSQGVIQVHKNCLSYYMTKNGIGLLLPCPDGRTETLEYYGSHQILERGVLPMETRGMQSVHRVRLMDERSFYLDSCVAVQGRVVCSPEGAVCAFARLRQNGLLQSQALALCEGGRLWIAEKGKWLTLAAEVRLLSEGTMFEKVNEVQYNNHQR